MATVSVVAAMVAFVVPSMAMVAAMVIVGRGRGIAVALSPTIAPLAAVAALAVVAPGERIHMVAAVAVAPTVVSAVPVTMAVPAEGGGLLVGGSTSALFKQSQVSIA